MDWVCQYCRRLYAVDAVVPADPQYMTTHGVCPACLGRPESKAKPRPMTRDEWVYALMEASLFGLPLPPNPAWGTPDAEVFRRVGPEEGGVAVQGAGGGSPCGRP